MPVVKMNLLASFQAVSSQQNMKELSFERFKAEFKDCVKDDDLQILHEPFDNLLLRFFNSCDAETSEKAFEFARRTVKDHFEWRQKVNIEKLMQKKPHEILGCDPRDIISRFPFTQYGIDREGRPVEYYFAKWIDARGIVKRTSAENFIKFHVWMRELSIKRLNLDRVRNIKPPYYLAVTDLSGIRLSQASSSFYAIIKLLIEIDDWHYPDRVYKMIIVNAPFFFNAVWKIIKRFAYHTIDRKLVICGAAQENVYRVLRRFIIPEQIPQNYGGLGAKIQNDIPHSLWPCKGFGTFNLKGSDEISQKYEVNRPVEYRDSTKTHFHLDSQNECIDLLTKVQQHLREHDQLERILILKRGTLREQVHVLKSDIRNIEQRLYSRMKEPIRNNRNSNEKYSLNEEKLRSQIEAVDEECKAYQKSIRFARNYMEQESRTRELRLLKLEMEAFNLQREQEKLKQALISTFGHSKAMSIFRAIIDSK